MKHILVVDDELGARASLKAIFSDSYRVSLAENAAQALEALSSSKIDLILLDYLMPGTDGVTLLKQVQVTYPDLPVIMVSASTSVRPVVEAIQCGAYDYVTKPYDVDEISHLVARAMENRTMQQKLEILEDELSEHFPVRALVGESQPFQRAIEDARKAADSNSTVLIMGESGTGKELIARLVHKLSSRKEEPFVAVHCPALPETLLESELFGYEKGAFTNAEKRKLGRFDLAGSGTLFFDEISEMSVATQAKLLRVLQEKEFMRIGGTAVIHTDARIVAATNKDLKEEVRQGRFREDLYYRISVIPVALPPLRQRREDIPLLARFFMNYFKQSINADIEEFSEETIERFMNYNWPGNIREMRNLIERLLVLHRDARAILPEFLPDEFNHQSSTRTLPLEGRGSLDEAVNNYERELVMRALEASNGVQTKAARLLRTTRRILKYRMDKLNIRPDAFKTSPSN